MNSSQATQKNGEVEVWPGKCLYHGETDEKVARADPALGHHVLAQQGDHHGAAPEDDGPGEVHVREEAVEQRGVGEGAAQDDDDDKGGEEGGNLVFEGTPENLIKNKESLTAKYLKEKLK